VLVAVSLVGARGAWPAEAFDLGFAGLREEGFVEPVQRAFFVEPAQRALLSWLSEILSAEKGLGLPRGGLCELRVGLVSGC
jgi:hypothetical protein